MLGKGGNQTQMTEFVGKKSPFVKKGATFNCLGCNKPFPLNSSHQSYCPNCARTIRQKRLRTKLKETNPLKWKIRMLYTSLHGFGIKVSTETIGRWIENTPNCVYCESDIITRDYSIDHIIPRSRNGSDTLDNIQLICRSCNMMKGNLLDSEFKELMGFLKERPTIYAILKTRLKAAGFMYGGKL